MNHKLSTQHLASDANHTSTQNLFISFYPELRESIFDEFPSCTVFDADSILDLVAQRQYRFRGDPATFQTWCERHVRPLARHRMNFYRLINENTRVIYGAIRDVFKDLFYADASCSRDDVFAEITFLIYKRVYSFLQPSRAKVSTRLYRLAVRHCLDYHIKKRKARYQAVERFTDSGRRFACEVISDLETASMRADQLEAAA